ncbi:MAG TPA: ACT domain-containing protein, partial [Actinomycetota bacterium]|nr:ACT domain-containing protein [Actinomycetota bacterium]
VFFLQIGMRADVAAFAHPWVLGVASLLALVAVAGKVVAGLGARRGAADRVLVGIAMIPRGEVGLIFATIGLSEGVLDAQSYAVLLLVVVASTLVTPPWIRSRIERARRVAAGRAGGPAPSGGWLVRRGDEVELAGDPPPSMAAELALEAAVACASLRPGEHLVSWLGAQTDEPTWDDALRRRFFTLLQEGSERSWRFLEVTGSLRWLLPTLDEALARRPRDPFDLAPAGSLRLPVLDGLRRVMLEDRPAAAVWAELREYEEVLLAALIRDLSTEGPGGADLAHDLSVAIGWSDDDGDRVAFLVSSRHLLPAASSNLDITAEHHLLDLASFIETVDRLDGLYLLAVAENAMEPWERERLDETRALIIQALAHPELTGRGARVAIEARLHAVRHAMPDLSDREFRHFVDDAPRRYLLVHGPDTIVRHVRMAHPHPTRSEIKLEAEPAGGRTWTVHVVLHDRPGALAAIAAGFADRGISVHDALISTWEDGIAIDVFRVEAPEDVDWDAVRRRVADRLVRRSPREEDVGEVKGHVRVDGRASPWHSIVELRTPDRAGLLARVAAAMSKAGVEIHEARVSTQGGEAIDSFWVTGRTGHKLTPTEELALQRSLAGASSARRRPRFLDRVRSIVS